MIFLSLFGALVGGVLAFVVLSLANNEPVDDWSVSPTVYLSIIATFANVLIRSALGSGLDIFWWTRLLSQPGVTLRELHDIWHLGHEPVTALLQIPRSLVLVRSAVLLGLLLAVNGPLLQEAITVESVNRTTFRTGVLPIRAEPIWNLTTTSRYSNDGWHWSPPPYQPEFADLVFELNQRRDPQLTHSVCPTDSTCTANVTVAGFSRNCTYHEVSLHAVESIGPAQFIVLAPVDGSWNSYPCSRTSGNFSSDSSKANPLDNSDSTYCNYFQTYYQLALNIVDEPVPGLNYTSYIRTEGTSDILSVTRCTFTTAFIQMHIRITRGNMVSILPTDELPNSSPLEIIPSAARDNQDILGAFSQTLKDQYEGYIFYDANEYSNIIQGLGPRAYVNSSSILREDSQTLQYTFSCLDPLEDFTNTLNEVSLRYAIKSMPTDTERVEAYERYMNTTNDWRSQSYPGIRTPISSDQSVDVVTSTVVTIYKAHFEFCAVVVVVILLSTFTITMLLLGWRRLGRDFSLSPLEIAKAFDAPLLSEVESNTTAADIVKKIGSTRVQYGEAHSTQRQYPLGGNGGQNHPDENQGFITEYTAAYGRMGSESGSRLMIGLAGQVNAPENKKAYV